MALIKLTWNNNSFNEDGFNIYRSTSPMDINNLPSPITTLGSNTGSYDDFDVASGKQYFYRIGVFTATDEVVGKENVIRASDSLVFVSDAFGDGSNIATFSFNNTLQSMDGGYTLLYNATEVYSSTSIEGESFEIDTSTDQRLTTAIDISPSNFSVAGWFNLVSKKQANLFGFGDYTIGLWSESGDDFWVNEPGTYNAIGFSEPINLNEWVHIVGVFDIQNQESRVYFNGELMNQSPNNTSSYPTDFRLMGRDDFGQSQDPGSKVDQLRVFNKALTSDEVTTLYQKDRL